jgi:hypothetical protein
MLRMEISIAIRANIQLRFDEWLPRRKRVALSGCPSLPSRLGLWLFEFKRIDWSAMPGPIVCTLSTLGAPATNAKTEVRQVIARGFAREQFFKGSY